MQDNDIGRNFLEEILLKINSLKCVTDKARDNFDADNKLDLQKIVRAALKQNYEQKLFLKVAKEHGYEAAEECKGNEMEDGAMDDSMQKRYADIKKKYDTKTAQPYRSTSFKKRQPGNQQAPAYPVPMQNQFVQQQGFPTLPGLMGSFPGMQSQLGPFPVMQSQLGQMMRPQVPNMSAFGQFQQPVPRFRARQPFDKSNSIWKACQGIGHWAGDRICPLSGFSGNSQVGVSSPRLPLVPPVLPASKSPLQLTMMGQGPQDPSMPPPPPGTF